MTNGEFYKLMKFMKGIYTYSSFANTEEAYEIWRTTFDKYTYDECLAGVKEWTGKKSVPPTPADINENIIRLRSATETTGKTPIWQKMNWWGLYDPAGKEVNECYAHPYMSNQDVKAWFSKTGDLEGYTVRIKKAAEV